MALACKCFGRVQSPAAAWRSNSEPFPTSSGLRSSVPPRKALPSRASPLKPQRQSPARRASPRPQCSLGAEFPGLKDAAQHLVDDFIRSDMTVGIGGGPGSIVAIDCIASKIKSGTLKNLTLVPSSAMLASEIANHGIPMATMDDLKLKQKQLDVAFCEADTAQEGTLYSIIGRRGVAGRGSLQKEKAMAAAAKQFLLLVPGEQFVDTLNGTVPVEIEQFNWMDIAEEVDDIFIGDAEVWRRPSSGDAGPLGGDFPFMTESGHYVLDLKFTVPISNPEEVAKFLESVPGVVAHGILINEAYAAAVAHPDGVKIRTSLFRTSFT